MRDKALAVDCPAREPDSVLLAQLTTLAAASTVPAVKPWWQRFTVKTGAAAVAGVLMISGATADAEHAPPRPIAVTIVHVAPSHPAPQHKPARAVPAHTSTVVFHHAFASMRHAGKRAHLRERAHSKKHQDGNSNGGGNENGQSDVQFARLAPTQVLNALQDAQGHSHPHTHVRQRGNSQH
jgi:hypothetical protein